MQLAAHGSYTLDVTDNMLIVDARGLFNDTVVEQYQQDIRVLTKKLSGQPWGSLVTFYGSGIFTPDSEEALVKLTKYRVKHGMIANATVIIDSNNADLQQMQLRRIYQSSNVIFHVFSHIEHAKEWLSGFLKQKNVAG